MSETTQPTTFADLVRDLLNRTRQDTSSAATATQARRYLNTALYDLHVGFGEKFPWAERTSLLITHPPYSTGTLSISIGLNFVFGIGTAWNSTNDYGQQNVREGGKFRIYGYEEAYEVTDVTASNSATLDTTFIGPNVVGAGEYVYYEDEYDLASDFLRPLEHRRFTDGPTPIALISRSDFRNRFPGRYVSGKPEVATIVDRAPDGNTTPRRRVRFYMVPDKAYQIRYSYVTSNLAVSSAGVAASQMSSDTDEPIVPIRYRHVLVLHALYQWYRDKKDDQRSFEVKNEYEGLLARITGDNEIGSNKARINPRVGPYASRAHRPWASGRRFDVNGRFDRLEDLG